VLPKSNLGGPLLYSPKPREGIVISNNRSISDFMTRVPLLPAQKSQLFKLNLEAETSTFLKGLNWSSQNYVEFHYWCGVLRDWFECGKMNRLLVSRSACLFFEGPRVVSISSHSTMG
jgi:hypothetical protein